MGARPSCLTRLTRPQNDGRLFEFRDLRFAPTINCQPSNHGDAGRLYERNERDLPSPHVHSIIRNWREGRPSIVAPLRVDSKHAKPAQQHTVGSLIRLVRAGRASSNTRCIDNVRRASGLAHFLVAFIFNSYQVSSGIIDACWHRRFKCGLSHWGLHSAAASTDTQQWSSATATQEPHHSWLGLDRHGRYAPCREGQVPPRGVEDH